MALFAGYESYDGLGLAELVRQRATTPLELVEAAIARIEMLNPQLNAVIHPMFNQARALRQKRCCRMVPFGESPFCSKTC